MEYGNFLENQSLAIENIFYNDFSQMKYVGYRESKDASLFTKRNLDFISKKITEKLKGIRYDNRDIIVPNETIASVLSNVYESFRPESLGSIYGRYTFPPDSSLDADDYIKNIVNQTMAIIVSDVKNTTEIEENNKKLSVWTTVLGEGLNDHGLRAYPPIKIREKRPDPFQFHIRY